MEGLVRRFSSPPYTGELADRLGEVYVPPGDYGMSTWVSLSGGQDWAFQLDGIIYRTGLVAIWSCNGPCGFVLT